MNILIDATNIISGGGASHLIELLNATNSNSLKENDISKIVVVGVFSVTEKLHSKEWLEIINIPQNKSNFIHRFIWKKLSFNKIIKNHLIDIIFNPGGSYYGTKLPYVTMCRNMLVFETKEADRFGFTLYRLKFMLLRFFQTRSMKGAKGVIFISKYAQSYIKTNYHKIKINKTSIINHGVSKRFRNKPKNQKNINFYNKEKPYKILYVSTLDVYKHHDRLAKAIVKLVKNDNLPLEFIVIGQKAGGYKKFEAIRSEYPNIIKYSGKIPFEEIQLQYKEADLFVFGSTCENMPNILIEAMSSGLPIACSDKKPMPEFLGKNGAYFSVENPDSIYNCLKKVILNTALRSKLLEESLLLSTQYSWENCSDDTFKFISECYDK